MTAPIIQAEYEVLQQIAQRFGACAERITTLRMGLTRQAQVLEQGGWQGQAMEAFTDEMDSLVLPAITRLRDVLESAQTATLHISTILRDAETQAAAVFAAWSIDDTFSTAPPTTAAGGTGSGGGSGGGGSITDATASLMQWWLTTPVSWAIPGAAMLKNILSGLWDAMHSPTTTPKTSKLNALLATLQTTGASALTAKQDGLSSGGVEASHTMAKTDFNRVEAMAPIFREMGEKYDIPPALLAAIASRETRGGNLLDAQGLGDNGAGFGVMQVDKNQHPELTMPKDPYGREHIEQATIILKDLMTIADQQHPDWPADKRLRAAVAAYNGGTTKRDYAQLDSYTTGKDYSADVWARAQYYADEMSF